MKPEEAKQVIAAEFVARAVREAFEFDRLGWEHYPEVGEHDWLDVVGHAKSLAAAIRPSVTAYTEAHEVLTDRANS
jgi:hypothetical protein